MKGADAKVSSCANPECGEVFKRLGEGKLFVRPSGKSGRSQIALWLCPKCAKEYDLRYDRREHEFHLIRHKRVA